MINNIFFILYVCSMIIFALYMMFSICLQYAALFMDLVYLVSCFETKHKKYKKALKQFFKDIVYSAILVLVLASACYLAIPKIYRHYKILENKQIIIRYK